MIKINKKYKSLFRNKHRYNIISGGRASGKSYTVALYLLLLTLEKGNVILFSRYTMTSVGISVFPEFIDKIETLGLQELFEITSNEIINKETGSKIIFKGIKTGSSIQTANLKSIANLNIVVIDEAEEIPDEETFDKIDLSARRKDKFNKIILIFNPTTKAHWIYERFFESQGIMDGQCIETDDTNYIHSTYLDNIKHLSDSVVKQIEKIKQTNPTKYKHIILGAFLAVAEGVIFTDWSIGKFDDNLEWGMGLDFGFSPDPDSLTKVAIDKVNKKIYVHEELYQTEVGIDLLKDIVKKTAGNREVIADNQANRLIDEIKRHQVNITPCVKGAGSVEEGIKLLQGYHIVVTPESKNIIKELNNYIWSNKKAGVPRDLYNHSIDGIRYYVTHKLKNATITKFKIFA
jgi:phage terminase large subunit